MTAPGSDSSTATSPCEISLKNAELLLRQVHPTKRPGGGVDYVAFLPNSSDKGLLSTLREHVGAQAAHARRLADGGDSDGTWSVDVLVAIQQLLDCVDDSNCPGIPDDHASVDFRQLQRKQKQQAARKLLEASQCLYLAPCLGPSGK